MKDKKKTQRNVSGGNDSTTRTVKFGGMEFKVEEQQGVTEDDLKGSDAKATRGAQSLVKKRASITTGTGRKYRLKNNRKIMIWIAAAILIVAAVFGIWHASGAGGRRQNIDAEKTIHMVEKMTL